MNSKKAEYRGVKFISHEELEALKAENERLREALNLTLDYFQAAYNESENPKQLYQAVVGGWECLIDGGIPEEILKTVGGGSE